MKVLAGIAFFIGLNAHAQVNGDWIESGPMKLRVNADGQIATFNSNAASEINAGSNNHIFKFINMWISGYDSDNKLYTSSVNGFNAKSDYSPGPIDSLTYAGANPIDWNKVWSVNSDEISHHRKHFKSTTYQIPLSIKQWPSNGYGRFNKYLAPFIDYNADGRYNPEDGDYPNIKGHKALYFIVNDNYLEHKASGGAPLKLEIYGMAYSVNSLPNTIFINYYLVNRTNKDFNNLKVSFHTGFQLGNDFDNFCGTLVPQNMIFSYNGDSDDENHFGLNNPLGSLMFLNKNLSTTLALQNDTNKMNGMPTSPQQHRYVMEGKWKTNTKLTFGDDGTGNNPPSNYMYPGKSDPSFPIKDWTELSNPGNRSMLANLDYTQLISKDFIEINLAISGYGSSNGNPYEFLKTQADYIKNYWTKNLKTSLPFIEKEFTIKNPVLVGENITEEWFDHFKQILVYNSQGQLLNTINPSVQNLLTLKTTGMHYLIFKTDNQIITKKILAL